MINTIIFDCDGVVIDSTHVWVESTNQLLTKRGLIFEGDILRPLVAGKTLLESSKIIRDFYHLRESSEEIKNERYNLASELLKKQINFIPGFLDFFNSLKTKYKSSVATSMNPDLFKIIDPKLQIKKLFNEHIYFGEHLKDASKPKPDIFLHAAQMTNSKPDECLVIEDAPNGVKAAKAAHMKCIAITTTFKSDLLTEADVVVNKFSDIDLSKF